MCVYVCMTGKKITKKEERKKKYEGFWKPEVIRVPSFTTVERKIIEERT